MLRRQLIAGVAAIAAARPAASSATALRRARPGEPSWPSDAQWSELDATSGTAFAPQIDDGALRGGAQSPACVALLKQAQNPFFVSDQPSGTQISGYLDAWSPAPSAYAVAAESAADVAAAVTFARAHNLRLVIKGGGHSYLGGSNSADSLLVWTHAMRAIQLHDAFTPEGCAGVVPPTPAVSLGAGCRWIEAYDAVTTKAGRYVQGGGCTTVGVAGLLGGGFGSFSKRYGTAASNLLEAEIVTADGVVRIVNARQHPDLFWALKGGGGGSFGVVTRLTVRTHEAPMTGGSVGFTLQANSDEAFHRLIADFVALCAGKLCSPYWGEQVAVTKSNALKVSMVTLDLDDAAAMFTFAPLLAAAKASGGAWRLVEEPDVGAAPFAGWWDVAKRHARKSTAMRYDDRPGEPPIDGWWSGDSEQVSAWIHGYDSVWLPRSLLTAGKRQALADALFAASRHFDVSLHFNKGLAGAPADVLRRSRDTATNPDVLDAFALAIIATGGPPAFYTLLGYPNGADFARRHAEAIKASAAALRVAAPGAGSYVSEANFFNPNWRGAFWGANYPKLRGIKARYDPSGLFFVHHGVGSEDWSADGFARLT